MTNLQKTTEFFDSLGIIYYEVVNTDRSITLELGNGSRNFMGDPDLSTSFEFSADGKFSGFGSFVREYWKTGDEI